MIYIARAEELKKHFFAVDGKMMCIKVIGASGTEVHLVWVF